MMVFFKEIKMSHFSPPELMQVNTMSEFLESTIFVTTLVIIS